MPSPSIAAAASRTTNSVSCALGGARRSALRELDAPRVDDGRRARAAGALRRCSDRGRAAAGARARRACARDPRRRASRTRARSSRARCRRAAGCEESASTSSASSRAIARRSSAWVSPSRLAKWCRIAGCEMPTSRAMSWSRIASGPPSRSRFSAASRISRCASSALRRTRRPLPFAVFGGRPRLRPILTNCQYWVATGLSIKGERARAEGIPMTATTCPAIRPDPPARRAARDPRADPQPRRYGARVRDHRGAVGQVAHARVRPLPPHRVGSAAARRAAQPARAAHRSRVAARAARGHARAHLRRVHGARADLRRRPGRRERELAARRPARRAALVRRSPARHARPLARRDRLRPRPDRRGVAARVHLRADPQSRDRLHRRGRLLQGARDQSPGAAPVARGVPARPARRVAARRRVGGAARAAARARARAARRRRAARLSASPLRGRARAAP